MEYDRKCELAPLPLNADKHVRDNFLLRIGIGMSEAKRKRTLKVAMSLITRGEDGRPSVIIRMGSTTVAVSQQDYRQYFQHIKRI